MSEQTADRAVRIVRIDPDIIDLIPGYLANRSKDIEALRAAVTTGDYTLVRRIAHQLRGSGGGYGLPAVTSMGEQLGRAAQAADAAAVRRCTDQLEHYLADLEIVPLETPEAP